MVTAKGSMSIGRESLQVFLCCRRHGVPASFTAGGQSWRNMAWTGNKKAFCVLLFAKTESIVTVQRRFRITYVVGNCKTQNAFLFPVHAMFLHGCPLAVKPAGTPRRLRHKRTWTDSLPFRRDHPGYCTAEVGNPRGTYELPCIYNLPPIWNVYFCGCDVYWEFMSGVSILLIQFLLNMYSVTIIHAGTEWAHGA
jgi:hypothetical protein